MSDLRSLGVMVLPDIVLFPQMTLPLYIFEERYRQLLEESLEADRMFAVSRASGFAGEKVFGVGLLKTVVRNSDGTYHIIVEGTNRYGTVSVESEAPILRVKARLVREVVPDDVPRGQKEHVLEQLRGFDDGQGKVRAFVDQLAGLDIQLNGFTDIVAASFLASSDSRQKLLDEPDPIKRLTMLEDFLDTD